MNRREDDSGGWDWYTGEPVPAAAPAAASPASPGAARGYMRIQAPTLAQAAAACGR